MMNIKRTDIANWKVIIHALRITMNDRDAMKDEHGYDYTDSRHDHINSKAMQIIFSLLTIEENNQVNSCSSAKELWDRLKVAHD